MLVGLFCVDLHDFAVVFCLVSIARQGFSLCFVCVSLAFAPMFMAFLGA